MLSVIFSVKMIVDNFLLPRFLILELVFACHYFEYAKAVNVFCDASESGDSCQGSSFPDVDVEVKDVPKKPIDQLTQPLRSENLENSDLLESLAVNSSGGEEGRQGNRNTCKFSLTKQKWKFPPLLFDVDDNPILPLDDPNNKDMVVEIAGEERVTVLCPGKKVNNSPDDRVVVSCHAGRQFHLGEKLLDIDQLGCLGNPAEAEIIEAEGSSCGPAGRGVLSQIGFKLNKKRIFPVITVCHSRSPEITTFYTNHTLYGKFLHYKSIYEKSANFNREGRLYFQSISANDAYKQVKQKRIFSSLVGPGHKITEVYNPHDGLFLCRCHLAPKADLLYTDWQEASYLFSNIVPQWQRINHNNWKQVEEGVRAAARRRGVTFQVVTGVSGVLRINKEEVWLAEDNIPVPEYLWKLVVDTKTGESIVFVTLNDPNVADPPEFCPNLCEAAGWKRSLKYRAEVRKGFTVCCSAQQFRKKLPWLPRWETSDRLLHF